VLKGNISSTIRILSREKGHIKVYFTSKEAQTVILKAGIIHTNISTASKDTASEQWILIVKLDYVTGVTAWVISILIANHLLKSAASVPRRRTRQMSVSNCIVSIGALIVKTVNTNQTTRNARSELTQLNG
jgi:hypothetical protein